MKTSERGRELLIRREGVRLKSYRDSVGVWTIGVGHTAAAGPPYPGPGVSITAAECEAILSRDLVLYERAIEKALTVPVAQHEFDALVSICFNVGPKFARSTCIKRLNAGDRKGAAEAIMLWRKPPEIIGRRRTEQAQFRAPYRVARTAAPPSAVATPAGHPAPGARSGWLNSLLSLLKRKA